MSLKKVDLISNLEKKQIEELLVQGRRDIVSQKIQIYCSLKLPIEDQITLSEWSHRIHEPLLALKILSKWIHKLDRDPNGRKDDNRSDELEKARPQTIARLKLSYGTSLFHLGAISSAEKILQEIDKKLCPESFLYLSGVYGFQWNYLKSIEVLNILLRLHGISPYRVAAARVNKIAALVALESFAEAQAEIAECHHNFENEKFDVLLGNLFELESQIAVFESKYELAIEKCKLALKKLPDEKSLYNLFVAKWLAIANANISPSPESKRQLELVRQRAIEMKHWNTLKDCDLFCGLIFNLKSLLLRAYHGTSNHHFKKRVQHLSKINFQDDFYIESVETEIGGALQWQYIDKDESSPNLSQKRKIFDPLLSYSKDGLPLIHKKLLFRVFSIFIKDVYESRTLGQIFEGLYPGENFRYDSSPQRVMKAMARFDQWLKQENIPLKVKIKKSEFELLATAPIRIVITSSWYKQNDSSLAPELDSSNPGGDPFIPEKIRVQKFFSQHPLQSFTAQDFASFENTSLSTAKRTLAKLTKAGALLVIGNRKSTRYKLTS